MNVPGEILRVGARHSRLDPRGRTTRSGISSRRISPRIRPSSLHDGGSGWRICRPHAQGVVCLAAQERAAPACSRTAGCARTMAPGALLRRCHRVGAGRFGVKRSAARTRAATCRGPCDIGRGRAAFHAIRSRALVTADGTGRYHWVNRPTPPSTSSERRDRSRPTGDIRGRRENTRKAVIRRRARTPDGTGSIVGLPLVDKVIQWCVVTGT